MELAEIRGVAGVVAILLPFGWATLAYDLVAVLLAGLLVVVFHELAHLTAAVQLRVRAKSIAFGTGPLLCRVRIFGVDVMLRAWLITGEVQLAGAFPEDPDITCRGSLWLAARWKCPVIAAAGPLSDLGLAAIFLGINHLLLGAPLGAPSRFETPANLVFTVMTLVALYCGVNNLVPLDASDGDVIVRQLRTGRLMTRREFTERRAQHKRRALLGAIAGGALLVSLFT